MYINLVYKVLGALLRCIPQTPEFEGSAFAMTAGEDNATLGQEIA